MNNLKLYATIHGEIDEITVLGSKYQCVSCYGSEYLQKTNKKFSYGFPFYPYILQCEIDRNSIGKSSDRFAVYIVDGMKIIWIYDGSKFKRPNLQSALLYINIYESSCYISVDDVISNF